MTITLSDDRARLQLGRIHEWLAASYWSPGIERSLVERAIAGSHCVGAYDDDRQVGFARLIGDRATFAWLADVIVDEPVRGQGIGRRMARFLIDHPDHIGVRRVGLVTADAHGVYETLGFHPLLRPDRYMERLSPEAAAILKATP